MPIYEYLCPACETKFEEFVRTPAQRIACPSCESTRVQKLFSTFGFSSGGNFSPSVGGAG